MGNYKIDFMADKSLIYIANARMPTEKAHGFQVAKMCEAFATHGLKVLLLAPKRKNPIKEELFSYFGIKNNFEIKYLPIIDTVGFAGPIGYWLENLTFSFSVAFFLFSRRSGIFFTPHLSAGHLIPQKSAGFIFTRDIFSGFLASFLKREVIFEMHDFPKNYLFFWRLALNRMHKIISTNRWKAKRINEVFGISDLKILAAPNGFDPELFLSNFNKEELRIKLGLPLNKVIALYAGHLYGWKGADTMAKAAFLAPEIIFVFVGGTEADLSVFRKKNGGQNNILIVGHKPPGAIPLYLLAADILVLPNSAKTEESMFGTSPIKLFSYMASGRPIVASDLPSIREIVSEKEVLFVRPDDPAAIKEGILKLINDPMLYKELSDRAKIKSEEFTWENRAGKILNWIEKVI